LPLWYRLYGQDKHLIWISNDDDIDSVAVDARGFVPSFQDLDSLREYAIARNYPLETEQPNLHNLDWFTTWHVAPSKVVDCHQALSAWNLFSDIAASFSNRGFDFESRNHAFPSIYKKLFYGNNLPAVTPPGKQYIPEWSKGEINCLDELLAAGLDMFLSSVQPWNLEPDGSA
jgi:hypothetical protein